MAFCKNEQCDKICIEAKRVFDACIKQLSEEDTTIIISDVSPASPATPLHFVSARSTAVRGTITDLSVDVISSSPRTGRIQGNVEIPVVVNYLDNNGVEGSGTGTIIVPIDNVMNLPEPSVMPYEIQSSVSAVCPSGQYSPTQPSAEDEYEFIVHLCASIILKVVCIVDIVINTLGYASIPPCVSYTQDACSGFFELPLFPSGTNT